MGLWILWIKQIITNKKAWVQSWNLIYTLLSFSRDEKSYYIMIENAKTPCSNEVKPEQYLHWNKITSSRIMNTLPSSMQFLKFSSEDWFKHFVWKSFQYVIQDLLKVFEHKRWHWGLFACWQQCHFALSIPTLEMMEPPTEVVGDPGDCKMHCQKKSCNFNNINSKHVWFKWMKTYL